MQLSSDLVERLNQAVVEAVRQIVGGSHSELEIQACVRSTLVFPNKDNDDTGGSPHDVEMRIALKLFHQTRKQQRSLTTATASIGARQQPSINVVSDLGLQRTIMSPVELAELLCQVLNQEWDVRMNASGILCLVTQKRAHVLRASGQLPCPYCIKWCKGEKGLWWHQQREHGSDHAIATEKAASERNTLALVTYNPQEMLMPSLTLTEKSQNPKHLFRVQIPHHDIFELSRLGNLDGIEDRVRKGIDVADTWDAKGALPLHWAAGYGHLAVVRFLIEECQCNANVGQRGKRSFSGRTALHWAARNGHLDVVMYLVEECQVPLDEVTIDGTSAFGWACWQGHVKIMKYLREKGCDIHKTNSFGCNAVLWCAQGEGSLDSIQWLHQVGCEMSSVNSNGHSALHKAAQRGREDLVDWLVETMSIEHLDYSLIGPDKEGCCPSDLAGMEGHDKLAAKLVQYESKLARILFASSHVPRPVWLNLHNGEKVKDSSIVWGSWSGTIRMCRYLWQCEQSEEG